MRYLCSICRMKEDNMNLSVIKQAEKTPEPETNKLYLSESFLSPTSISRDVCVGIFLYLSTKLDISSNIILSSLAYSCSSNR